MAAGTYSFVAKANYADRSGQHVLGCNHNIQGRSWATGTFGAGTDGVHFGKVCKIVPEHNLLATVVGISPVSLAKLTLNDMPQPLRTGNFVLNPPLIEGKNVFVLVATDEEGKNRQAQRLKSLFLDLGA